MTGTDVVEPPPEIPAPPPHEGIAEHRHSLWWRKAAFLVPLVALAIVLGLVRIPYFVLSPGPAQDVLPLIHVEDHRTYPPDGHLLLTSVFVRQANVYEAVWGWLDSTQAVVPERDILLPGESQEQEFQRALSQMDTSKIDAAFVALSNITNYPEEHGKGVLVESVVPGAPADGRLFAGDLIVSVDGEPIDDSDELGKLIRGAGVGHPLTFHIEAGGEAHDVKVAPVRVKDVSYPIVGISPVNNFPFPLTIDSGNIGGPSAGLMWTLGVVDVLTPGDLTGGRIIAGTGTIDITGTVGPIGGIQEKVVAAERAGAKIFFAPALDAPSAKEVADRMVVVSVSTYQDALDYLRRNP